MTSLLVPSLVGQIALSYGGVVDACRADEDDYDAEGNAVDAVEGMHRLEITFPNLWKAMEFHQAVTRPHVVGFPPQAREVDLFDAEKVTNVAHPVTLRVLTNPDYAEAVFSAHFGAKA